MPDNKHKTDNRDRLKVASGQDYEVAYLVEKTGISREQALKLIERYGNDRQTLMKHARSVV